MSDRASPPRRVAAPAPSGAGKMGRDRRAGRALHSSAMAMPPIGRAPVALACLCIAPAAAYFNFPDRVPVDRLVRNASAYVSEHPDDPHGHYVLGRIHALAFTLETGTLAAWNRRDQSQAEAPPDLADDHFQSRPSLFGAEGASPEITPNREELESHLGSAITSFERALGMDARPESARVSSWGVDRAPRAALYHLGLAYLLERGAVLAGEADVLPGAGASTPDADARAELTRLIGRLGAARPAARERASEAIRARLADAAPILHELRDSDDSRVRDGVRALLGDHWREVAIAHYRLAWERSVADDLTVEYEPYFGLAELVSYEAGTGYVALVRARGVADGPEAERLEHVERSIAALEAKPPNGIMTPIILSLDQEAPLRRLLAPAREVCFDLDGDGDAEMWPWVAPGTAILVWDPDDTGEITSGRQLFGSVSWWLFPHDGYHALDLLDDNRDGELSGTELDGIALWFDGDSDGVSSPGEVIPAAEAGVVALAARALALVDGCPANQWGVELSDGRVLPTYDWITAPSAGTPEPAPEPARLTSR